MVIEKNYLHVDERKNVLNKIHATPMCFNALFILVAEVPVTRIANDKSRFSAGIEVPVITGWLLAIPCCFLSDTCWIRTGRFYLSH